MRTHHSAAITREISRIRLIVSGRTRVAHCMVVAHRTLAAASRISTRKTMDANSCGTWATVAVGITEEACITLGAVYVPVACGTGVAGGSSIAEGTSGARSRGVAGQALWCDPSTDATGEIGRI